ncbi:mannosyltransferase [Mycolicibacter arupensis]|uniref:Mannosyltransferase n=1 Tax=Mycolicibacter arupensis TaxID=342002 RepID=A0A5B1MDA7_9MYCO|nr:mannosyltransferase [Mycolicibacter arupensis]MCV7274070.1 mannosyltransferase [Mycolicibacter arupensis]OQZ96605.1 alpha-(1-2)-phosphatidylinositol mannosyltransferase [Mycolicibacter arupensis]TXI58496.1 MAG: mannosyltransferase [Mycolicibacter arupensis]
MPVDTTLDTPAARSWATRLSAWAPLLLVASIAARLAWTYLTPRGANFVDLHVYIDGAAALAQPGALYDYVYADQTPDFPLPFTYPPFAAVVFYPLHFLPFGLVAFLWQIGTMAALYGVVRLSQRLLGGAAADARAQAMLWTAVGIWIEPLRSTFDYGQINVILALAVLAAVCSRRWWVSGLLVGLAAGVKLTPAIAGVYLAGARRWAAAVFSAVVFAGTIVVSAWVTGDQARRYFTELLGDAHRVGPIGTSFNQSWRGGISRIVGHDAGYSLPVLIAIGVTAVLAVLAWRALNSTSAGPDPLGSLLVVELFGLLASPISWTHHWVWLLPLMIWLLHGPYRDRVGARVLGWGWLALTVIGVPWLLSFFQPTIWQNGRPWYLAWAGLVYIIAALATLAWMATTRVRPPAAD